MLFQQDLESRHCERRFIRGAIHTASNNLMSMDYLAESAHNDGIR